MKKLSIVLAIAILLGACAFVQAEERQMFRISVPFSFTAENTIFPAGVYKVYVVKPFNVLRLQSVDGHKTAFLRATPEETLSYSERAELVFRRIAGQYFLTEAREAGSRLHREFPLGNYAQELARKREPGQAPSVVTVAGR